MIKRVALLLMLLASLLGAAAAQERQHVEEREEDQAPVQAYYHKQFFNEPWRKPETQRRIAIEIAIVLVAAGGVAGYLRYRRAA